MLMAIKKWHIYHANLEPVIGSEQGKSRPVLVVSEDFLNNLLNCVNIIPLTSRKTGRVIYPNEVLISSGEGGITNDSIALCHQIRTIDKRRLSRAYGEISNVALREGIIEAICFQIGINR